MRYLQDAGIVYLREYFGSLPESVVPKTHKVTASTRPSRPMSARREGGFREGGFRGDREGGFRGDREGGYRGDREGGYRPRKEGAAGESRPEFVWDFSF
jgi:hypothetical protein